MIYKNKALKTHAEILADPKDDIVMELSCGCQVSKSGKSYMTPIRCREHAKAFNIRKEERAEKMFRKCKPHPKIKLNLAHR